MFGLTVALDIVLRGLVLTAVALTWVEVLVRVIGLRTFSKITAFAFVATVAMGSLLATAATASSWRAFGEAVFVMAVLLGLRSPRSGPPMRRRSTACARSSSRRPVTFLCSMAMPWMAPSSAA